MDCVHKKKKMFSLIEAEIEQRERKGNYGYSTFLLLRNNSKFAFMVVCGLITDFRCFVIFFVSIWRTTFPLS